MIEVICAECNIPFVPSTKHAVKYCSVRCRDNNYLKRYRDKKREFSKKYYREKFGYKPRSTKQIQCASCNTLFLPHKSEHICCSRKCSSRLRYKLNPQKHRDKVKRIRQKTHAEYKARGRMTWAEMRAQRGKSDAVYRKARYPWIPILSGIKHRALKDGRDFDLTFEWCKARWNGRCEVTNIEFILNSNGRTSFSPSIDRVDNDKGYTQNNCRFVLTAVNMFKYKGTDAEMYTIAKAIIANIPQ